MKVYNTKGTNYFLSYNVENQIFYFLSQQIE